jgi:hypothetical protein
MRKPCAATTTDQRTVSNTTVLDPKTLKEKRKFMDWTQPWFSRETVLAKEAEGIWTLTQPFQLGFGRFADARKGISFSALIQSSCRGHTPTSSHRQARRYFGLRYSVWYYTLLCVGLEKAS